MFQQYALIGMVKKDEKAGVFHLIPAHQIKRAEVEVPKLTLADSMDLDSMQAAADNLRQILPG
jgi:hypothetical protein